MPKAGAKGAGRRAVWPKAVRRVALLGLLVFGLTACEVDVGILVSFNSDGSGVVNVEVALNEEALQAVPDIDNRLRTSDLENPASGWAYNGPDVDEQGRTRFSLSKGFESPDEVQSVLNEIFGPRDVFRDFTFERNTSFAKTDYRASGVVDLSDGVDLFTDSDLTERLGGQPFGQLVSEGDAASLIEAVPMRLILDLPVGAQQVTPLTLGQGEVSIELTAEEESGTAVTLRWVAWAAIALFVLSVLVAVAGYMLEQRTRQGAGDQILAENARARSVGPAPPSRRLRLVALNPLGVVFEPADDPADMLVDFATAKGAEVDVENVDAVYRQAVLGRISPTDLWASLEVDGDPDELTDQFLDRYSVRSGARDLIAELNRRELSVVCLTNGIASWINALRDRHQLIGIDNWIVSSEVGVCLPDLGVYEAMRRTTSVPYEGGLLVDVSSEHLDAARSLGMSTALLADSSPKLGESPGHAVVTSFSDFFRRRRS